MDNKCILFFNLKVQLPWCLQNVSEVKQSARFQATSLMCLDPTKHNGLTTLYLEFWSLPVAAAGCSSSSVCWSGVGRAIDLTNCESELPMAKISENFSKNSKHRTVKNKIRYFITRWRNQIQQAFGNWPFGYRTFTSPLTENWMVHLVTWLFSHSTFF